MNYREQLTKNEVRAHAAHYENSNPAVYCGMWIDLSTFETHRDFIEFCNRLHANEVELELMF